MNALVPNVFVESLRNNPREIPGWLDQRRGEAIKTLEMQGVPHRRVEDWKYTDLKTALEPLDGSVAATANWSIDKIPDGITLFDLADLSKAPEWVRSHFGKAA